MFEYSSIVMQIFKKKIENPSFGVNRKFFLFKYVTCLLNFTWVNTWSRDANRCFFDKCEVWNFSVSLLHHCKTSSFVTYGEIDCSFIILLFYYDLHIPFYNILAILFQIVWYIIFSLFNFFLLYSLDNDNLKVFPRYQIVNKLNVLTLIVMDAHF